MSSEIKGTSVCYLDTIPYLHKGRAVALGFFDGIHAGHSRIIRKTVRKASLNGLTSCVQTFVNFNKGGSGLLTTVEEKREILSSMGVDELLVLDFNSVRDIPADRFMSEILNMKLTSCHLSAGRDFRFGSGAAGDAALLEEYGRMTGIEVEIFEDEVYGDDGRRISSTWLRECLERGDVELYSRLCEGRCFSYSGIVRQGKKLGRALGFPTANLELPGDKFRVRRGVYASRISLGSRKLYGVTNVGMRPTVDDNGAPTIETYIFDFEEEIYGARAKVELISFIRPELRFDSVGELRDQVMTDKETAKTELMKRGIIFR